MALIGKFEEKHMERNSIHKEIGASYTAFEFDGRKFLQIDSYGTLDRQVPGKKSQSIQLDEDSAQALYDVLKLHFRFS